MSEEQDDRTILIVHPEDVTVMMRIQAIAKGVRLTESAHCPKGRAFVIDPTQIKLPTIELGPLAIERNPAADAFDRNMIAFTVSQPYRFLPVMAVD